MHQSKCPECGNVDTLTEKETKRIIHCQRCYNHYKFSNEPFFKGFKSKRFFNLD